MISSLRAEGTRVIDLARPSPEAASAALALAVERGEIERLFIAGGDGLVHLAIQHVAATSIPVTIVPVGTGNDFVAALDQRMSKTTTNGISTDLIKVSTPGGSQSWAASVAIAGFPADINQRANTMSRRWGSNVYAVAAALQLPHFERRTIRLTVDSEKITTNTAMLAIGNTRYFGGGMLPCPDAQPDDHLLHFTSIEGVGRIGLLPHLLGRAGGTADRKEVRRERGRRIEIESQGELFWADGEPVGTSPLTFEVVPDALKVERVGADTS